MSENHEPYAKEYVDKVWQESATEQEIETGRSDNISPATFPPAFRLGKANPLYEEVQKREYGTPYRGGATVQHGVGQLYAPKPPDRELEKIPTEQGPVIGGGASDNPMPFPDPVPVQVISMPQPNNIPQQRDGQIRLPPRDGPQGVPSVQNVLSREQNRTNAHFAARNHTDMAGVPYCVHVTFQRDIGNFVMGGNDTPNTTLGATWGIPLKSDGSWLSNIKHTEGVYGFNTMHFDVQNPEYYYAQPRLLQKSLYLIDGMTAEEYYELTDSETMTHRGLLNHVRAHINEMDFMAMAEDDTWRIIHFMVEYSTQVG